MGTDSLVYPNRRGPERERLRDRPGRMVLSHGAEVSDARGDLGRLLAERDVSPA